MGLVLVGPELGFKSSGRARHGPCPYSVRVLVPNTYKKLLPISRSREVRGGMCYQLNSYMGRS
jgi:hypothetical protein